MSSEPNVLDPEWDAEMPDDPFRVRASRVGARAGSEELGATLYEIDAGGAVSPYHLHHANEELLIVLSGSPEIRTPGGPRRVTAGAVLAFPRGEHGAHAVSNPGPEPARVLFVSTMRFPDVAEHVDTGATMTITGPGAVRVFPAGSDMPVVDAVLSAMQANSAAAPGPD
ncbi:MAG: hypothetical protein QOH72_3146 [Solirubrobacteraceae bacterium]|jgi:uncharacterized cupin superfamily protein|nr:hypothetical protein [Solirubrobacteraceae bacterium]